jgi:hypothetical protein
MRTILTALLALGTATLTFAPVALAQVRVEVPGVRIGPDHDRDWRQRREESESRRDREGREAERDRRESRRDCVRGWDGDVRCR